MRREVYHVAARGLISPPAPLQIESAWEIATTVTTQRRMMANLFLFVASWRRGVVASLRFHSWELLAIVSSAFFLETSSRIDSNESLANEAKPVFPSSKMAGRNAR
jgi:hypothetical protein